MLSGDEMMARDGIWTGVIRELRQRMNEFTFDGVRFGEMLPETRSGSKNDNRLTKRSEEIVTAAFVLGRLGYSGVRFVTKDGAGAPLERPDLDALLPDGERVGVEVAQAGNSRRMQHDAHLAELEHTIRDLCETDHDFALAFGPYYLSVAPTSVLGEREQMGKKQWSSIIAEVEAFVRARGHVPGSDDERDPEHGYFGQTYPTLNWLGAMFHSSPADYGPYFTVMTGGTVNPRPETEEVIKTINRHRKSARTYRGDRLWLLLYFADSNELFRSTLQAIIDDKPEIAPFEQCHLTDACWRVASLP